MKPNLDCNYTFPLDLVLNGISFGIKLNIIITQIWFRLTNFRKDLSVCSLFLFKKYVMASN